MVLKRKGSCSLGEFFLSRPGQDREDQMVETLQSDGFSRRQAELALADVQWSSAEDFGRKKVRILDSLFLILLMEKGQ